MSELNAKVANAAKWSALAEITAKLISPITSMVLARLLTPEAFGVVATLTMVITFAEIFTDAGFQRYIVQHEFSDQDDMDKSTNVAFWSNLILSLVLWGFIALFSEQLAELVGNPGLGLVLTVACVSIPLNAFSSIQMAVFKRSLDFKSLFFRRLLATLIPLFVTIPLAFILKSYWSLVFGTIAVNTANAIVLMLQSPWKPSLYFDRHRLHMMFSFCAWSVIDAVLVWCTTYIEIFFIGRMLNDYYLGIYKTSISTVVQFTSIITAAVMPVLMPALSRTQNDYAEMRTLILKIQKHLAIFLIPVGFCIFMFSSLITDIMLGSQWKEAIPYIGIWGLMEVIIVIFARFCSYVYPAVGKPRLSVLSQSLHLVVLIPSIYIAIGYSFSALFYTRALIRLEGVLVNMIIAYYCIKLSPLALIRNVMPEFLSGGIMCLAALLLLRISSTLWIQSLWIVICFGVYLMVLSFFSKERQVLMCLKDKVFSYASQIR